MKGKNTDYNFIIGLFLIIIVLLTFSFFIEEKSFFQEKKIEHNLNYKKQYNFFEKKKLKEQFFILENEVLKLKISNIGGTINEVFLKKYKSYDPIQSYHKRNLFLVKNYSLFYKMNFYDKKNGSKIDTGNILFKPILFKKDKKFTTLILMYKNLNNNNREKGNLYYIYKIGTKKQYDLNFSVKTEKFKLNNTVFINLEQNIFPLEKDKNWENSYTQLYYYSHDLDKNKLEYLSEKNSENRNINNIKWFACKQQFFTTIFHPKNELKNVHVYSKNFNSNKFLKMIRINTYLNPNKRKELNFFTRFYFGPLDFSLLRTYNNNYEDIIPFGWGFLKLINKYFFLPIFKLLENTNLNYGIIIILMTIVVKLILYPITYNQYKLSVTMKLIRPYIEKINKKFGNKNIIEKQKSIISLYKKVGINPMSGCLSAIFQIPIFYSLFKFFPTLINLRGKSFLWVEDLTSYDSILELPFFIPFYGNHISLLTLLYSIALLIYTKLSNDGKNTMSNSDNYLSSNNMDIMLYLMPFVMLLFINSYASALSLYYFISNIINIGFFFIIKKFFLDEKKILLKIKKINNN
ncbi:YidC/Oxa1 family insertase periplasmic-domain containing protein [Blattabacterium cuenoti]|uniref:YidC/Oxa1 family insertase periplasmic-domain containing protein n=1 Tax=Blattabacterium cuenoti TaxID=1653831 RepID=UPI00163CC70D|nr:YidC/Oxa1 family insertase periplasmic-domain containing protein [Blattabacterium cuenoti]